MGLPDSTEELLARADEVHTAIGRAMHGGLVADLASALRDERHRAERWMTECWDVKNQLDVVRAELAETRARLRAAEGGEVHQ